MTRTHAVVDLDVPNPAALPRLMSVGVFEPRATRRQADLAGELERAWRLEGHRRDRWRRISAHAGIEQRHVVFEPDDVMDLTTGERMVLYERHAPRLGVRAGRSALERSGIAAKDVTDVIVVSCTGFSAPGLDTQLVRRLGLNRSVRRTLVGFMGCFGAIIGLRTAAGACSIDPGSVALIVCVELCSLHAVRRPTDDDLIASALFADGAAAAVIVGREARAGAAGGDGIGRVTAGESLLIDERCDAMTWRVTDHGFAMTLSRDVPGALRDAVRAADAADPVTWIVHPGGPGILEAIDEGLELGGGRGIEYSWSVLASKGNLSSASVLHVLQEAVARDESAPYRVLAFGPGLSLEWIDVTNGTQ